MFNSDNENRHFKHSHYHTKIVYPKSLFQRLYSSILMPLIILTITFLILSFAVGTSQMTPSFQTLEYILTALLFTFFRLLIAFLLALIVSVPLSLLITRNKTMERIFLPIFDIIQSIPVLAFFPVIILVFIHSHFLNGAAIFVFFLSMLWNIIFSVVGGLHVIPNDIKQAAQIFHITGWRQMEKITLPAVVPYVITGSLLAWAQGWNIIIVAEVLHTYIYHGTPSQDLFGIGSVLVNSSANGQQGLFILAIVAMIILIGLLNLFVWQKLLQDSEKFKFQ
jgi:NitT/TauT family transport system permease protein